MQWGMGVLCWPEPMFWDSTYKGLSRAIEGYLEANGGAEKEGPPTAEEMQEMLNETTGAT